MSLLSVKLFYDPETGAPKGYAFLTLDGAGAAHTLKAALDGAIVGGKRLSVDVSGKSRMPGT